jgi:hypothetical protein
MPSPLSNALTTLCLTTCLTTTAFAQSPCPAAGVTVDASGGRLGDTFRIDIDASPTVFGVLGLDFAQGPIPTPLGTICLGFTPGLLTTAFFTDPAGAAAIAGLLPPSPAFAGIDIYTAAITLDPAQPTGWGVSNGDSFRVREPRFWFISPGSATPFGTTPGAIAATGVIGDNIVFSQALTTTVRDATTVVERGWLMLLQGNGSLAAYDSVSPTPVFSTVLAGAAASAGKVMALPGGQTLLLLTFGTAPGPFGGGTPGSVHFVALPGGAVTSVALTAGNPDAMIRVPDTSLVFLRTANGVIPFDTATAQASPVIPLPSGFGGLVDWQVAFHLLDVLHSGQAAGPFGGGAPCAISVVDVMTQTVLSTTQLAMTAPVHILRAGMGSTGPSLYVYGTAAAALKEFAQVTVAPTATIPMAGVIAMELSSFGTRWLMVSNAPPSLLLMPAGITTPIALTLAGTPQPALAVSPSAGYEKACLVISNNMTAPFQTGGPGASVTLPFASASWIISD